MLLRKRKKPELRHTTHANRIKTWCYPSKIIRSNWALSKNASTFKMSSYLSFCICIQRILGFLFLFSELSLSVLHLLFTNVRTQLFLGKSRFRDVRSCYHVQKIIHHIFLNIIVDRLFVLLGFQTLLYRKKNKSLDADRYKDICKQTNKQTNKHFYIENNIGILHSISSEGIYLFIYDDIMYRIAQSVVWEIHELFSNGVLFTIWYIYNWKLEM